MRRRDRCTEICGRSVETEALSMESKSGEGLGF